jgi:hypothetical protein
MSGDYGQCNTCGEKYHSKHQRDSHVCLKKIHELNEELQVSLIDSFKGVPLRIDDNLPANRWYVAVSRDIYEQIMKG